MDIGWKTILWRQFGASIDMLENAIRVCPEELWDKSRDAHSFWYLAYHSIFFLDYYSCGVETEYVPPAPFTRSELDPSGVMPDRVYSKDELLAYLECGRSTSMAMIDALTTDSIGEPCRFARLDLTVVELFLYNMRHIQHHVAQLNHLLHLGGFQAPAWVSKVKV